MASTFCFTVTMLSHTFGNLATKNSRFSEWHVLLSFLKVIQNSSRLTNVSRLGKSELVTPTLFIWSSHAARHSCWVSPTYKQTKSFITMYLYFYFRMSYVLIWYENSLDTYLVQFANKSQYIVHASKPRSSTYIWIVYIC